MHANCSCVSCFIHSKSETKVQQISSNRRRYVFTEGNFPDASLSPVECSMRSGNDCNQHGENDACRESYRSAGWLPTRMQGLYRSQISIYRRDSLSKPLATMSAWEEHRSGMMRKGSRSNNGTAAGSWNADFDDLTMVSAVYLLALLTNGLQVISVLANRRTRRSLFHQFAGHTSVANLVTILASYPLDVNLLAREAWYPGSGVCKLILSIAVVGPAVTAFSLLLLHMERLLRYLSRGRKPLRAEPHLRGVIGLALAILVWVLGFILVLPFVVTMDPEDEGTAAAAAAAAAASCTLVVTEAHTVSMTALTLIIPSSVLVLLCLPNVCLYLLTTARTSAAGGGGGRGDVTEADKVQAGVLAMVTCLYLATRLPVEILHLIRLLVGPVPRQALVAFAWLSRVGLVLLPCLWFLLPQLRRNLSCSCCQGMGRRRRREGEERNSTDAQPSVLHVDEALSVV